MNRLLLTAVLLFIVSGVFAQAKSNEAAIEQETSKLVTLYQLDKKQAKEMKVIQERKFNNLEQIASLKTSNNELYTQKRIAIDKGTDASIRKMLNKDQMAIYNSQKLEQRKEQAALIKKMKQEGASKEDIQKAIDRLKNQ